MSSKSLSRRDFLIICSLSLGGLALDRLEPRLRPWPPEESRRLGMKGRVTAGYINIYSQPDFKTERLGRLMRDTLVDLKEELTSPHGPGYNPRWYRLAKGFVHSGYLQRVEGAYLNEPVPVLPEGGRLGEISVPFTQSFRSTRTRGWLPLYRLYFTSVHWVTHRTVGPDGEIWYGLTDEHLNVQYFVPAAHVRLVQPEELAPISAHVPPEEKRIVVSLQDQSLAAYEGSRLALFTSVSTGVPRQWVDSMDDEDVETETPEGVFHVQVKVPSKHMGDGILTSDLEAYELPGVPWVSFFHKTGVAFHGTYWHDNFGRKMSHGCVNMHNDEALWLYRWTTPVAAPNDRRRLGYGTRIEVIA